MFEYCLEDLFILFVLYEFVGEFDCYVVVNIWDVSYYFEFRLFDGGWSVEFDYVVVIELGWIGDVIIGYVECYWFGYVE